MAEKYHISPSTGNPNRCYAKKQCPLGASEDEHYPTKQAARAAFEASQNQATFTPVKKASKAAAKAPKAPVKKTAAASSPEELRESVRDYRDPATSEAERENIRAYWERQGVPNQFAAMLRAADAEKEQTEQPPTDGEDETVDPDDDFSDIKCEDCGKPLDKCSCGECEYCGAQEGDDHEEDCPLFKPKGYRYSWE